jgi:hypothetical protein
MILPRKRLFWHYHRLGSWQKVADSRGVNVAYVYKYAVKGLEPVNPEICKRLGIPRKRRGVTINQLLQLNIQDMPTPILKWALEHRQEMT